MKRKISLVIIALTLMATSSFGAQVNITIPDNQVTRVKSAMLSIYPNTECQVRDEVTRECTTLKYTNDQWLKEVIRRWIRDQVRNAEQRDAQEAARNTMPTDQNNIVQ